MPKRRRRLKPSLGLTTIAAALLLLAAYGWLLEASRPHVTGEQLDLSTFVDYAESGRILDAEVLDADAYVLGRYERDDGTIGTYNFPYLQDYRERLIDILLDNRIRSRISQQSGKRLIEPLTYLIPVLLIIVAFIYLFMSWRRGTGLFTRSGARELKSDDLDVSFADVAAQDKAVEELKEISEFLINPERFAALGAQIPKGILLYGPPGCGKTLIARALASEAGARFYSMSGSDFVEMFVGVGAARVRDLFRLARESAPAIVFIDELDSIGGRRATGDNPNVNSERDQALNQILSEMDGFGAKTGVIVLAATNRPDTLDPALLRPGRFDRTVGLEMPNEDGRSQILEVHARGKPLGPDVDLRLISRAAVGMTGADLAFVVNEAALLAARAGAQSISQEHLEQSLKRVLEEPERQRRLSMKGRSIGQRQLEGERVTFDEVAGIDHIVDELREVQVYLNNPEKYARTGARVPRGFLLSGPPGCGKTLVARALAGEANAAFISVSASEFVELYVGQGASRVRDLFSEARSVAPSIVFIDEIDAIGGHRSSARSGGDQEYQQTINQLLTELDGFKAREGVIVMAATNRPDILDRALIRPGRFDRQLSVDLPDRTGRRQILEVHARGKPVASDVDLDRIAAMTPGFSGADLENALNEAALLAARQGRELITANDVVEGVERAAMGIEARGRILSDHERRRVAYHEAAHALVGWALPEADPPQKITILPRGRALGYVWRAPEADKHTHSRSAYLDQIAALLAGRVADELVTGEPDDGASSDLQKATETARKMVAQLGMSTTLGPLGYIEDDQRGQSYSEETARLIDAEARKFLAEGYQRARGVLTSLRDSLDLLAETLLERETLSREELEELLGSRDEVQARRVRRARSG